MTRQESSQEIVQYCRGLTVELLDGLNSKEFERMDCVDIRWCETEWKQNYYDSEAEAVSVAIYSEYESILEDRRQ